MQTANKEVQKFYITKRAHHIAKVESGEPSFKNCWIVSMALVLFSE